MFDFGSAWQNMYNSFVGFLPELIGALLILLVAHLVGKSLQWTVGRLLTAAKFDQALADAPAGNFITQLFVSPTHFTARFTYWMIFLGGLSMAIGYLNIAQLDSVMMWVYSYIPHLIVAVLIFLVASAVSSFVSSMIRRVQGDTPLAKTSSVVASSVIMSIAVFMMLNELMIAPEIVMITYTAILGAVALGLALAFGVGGRDVAAKLLDQAYEAGKKTAASAKKSKK